MTSLTSQSKNSARRWAGAILHAGISVFPLSIQGVAVLLLAGVTLQVYAYGSLDLIVFALAICALTVLVVSLFCTVGSGLLLQHRVQRNSESNSISPMRSHFEAGFPNDTGFSLEALRFLPLVKLSWQVIYPDHMNTRITVLPGNELGEEVLPLRRCYSKTMIRRFEVTDVLGLCRFTWRQRQEVPCYVLPKIHSMKPLPILRSLTSEDGIPSTSGNPEGDRMEIRPYVSGDSVKNIMWKAYARSGQLNVRLPERSVFQSRRTLAYLLSSEGDEAAAATARMALQSGALGDEWSFGADGSNTSCTSLEPALRILAQSRGIGEQLDYGLDEFLGREGGSSQAHCIVFAGAELAPWLRPLQQSMARHGGLFSLVLATDGFQEDSGESFFQRLILRVKHTERSAAEREELAQLLVELGQLASSILIVDRLTGHCFDQRLRRI